MQSGNLKAGCNPPSSKMTANASWLMTLAKTKLSKSMRPIPSSPANIPTARNTNKSGIPSLADKVVETTLKNNNAPPSKNRLFIQSTLQKSLAVNKKRRNYIIKSIRFTECLPIMQK